MKMLQQRISIKILQIGHTKKDLVALALKSSHTERIFGLVKESPYVCVVCELGCTIWYL